MTKTAQSIFLFFALLIPGRAAPPRPAISKASSAPEPSAETTRELEIRVSALLARMTLDEKIGQMSQSTSMQTPISNQIKDEIRHGRWGSFLNAGSPADRAEAQRISLKESRLGIPLLFGRDVIHGYKTVFPIPLGQSASWDPALIQEAARIAASEAATEGIHWTFAPMLDITRDPRWGRVAETLGEDPYLTSALGAAMVKGFQGNSLSDLQALAACAKHYVGYGATEAGREYNSTWIPETVLRQIYLQPFRAARDAGVATFMTGFNALNGIPASGNQFTVRDILRKEWGYQGTVVSDYQSIQEMVPHGYAADPQDAALKGVRASIDMEMVSTTYFDHLKGLVRSGQVTTLQIDDSVRRILRLKFQLGLFENKRVSTPSSVAPTSFETAKQLAQESMVLLKNDGTLPLPGSQRKIAVIGPLADSPTDQMGTWVMDGVTANVVTPLAALRTAYGNAQINYVPALTNSRDESREHFSEALQAAQSSDVVLLFLGEEQILSGEARSRAFLDLPGAQEALVDEIFKAGKPTIAVILAGRPLTFSRVAEKANAVLFAWHPGTMGGPAIADLVTGKANPSGKLTITFPRTVGQVPIYYAHLNTGRPAPPNEPGIPLGTPANPEGYFSKYIDVNLTPAYPFGFGLSYTKFAYSPVHLSSSTITKGGRVTATATVTNQGTREGTEVVQLYIRDLVASVAQPVRELKGFERISLAPGASREVTFSLTAKDLAFYNQRNELVTEPGRFQVWIASDSEHGEPAAFQLK